MATIIIPARLNSSRLPQKLIQRIKGKEVLLHLCDRIRELELDHELIVCTDSSYIEKLIQQNTTLSVLRTNDEFKNGTERCAWAVQKSENDIIINIQGDEMMCEFSHISALIKVMDANPNYQIATLIGPMKPDQYEDRSVVKAQVDCSNNAIDFVRYSYVVSQNLYSHIGVYAYRKQALQAIINLPVSFREEQNSLEQLRWLDAGYQIHCHMVDDHCRSINTLTDLKLFREYDRIHGLL